MSESQYHGIIFEDIKIKELTGIHKKEYDKLKAQGYTSSFDLVNGIIVPYNGSIKTTGNGIVNCADILNRLKETDYRLIVGIYNQEKDIKFFYTEYEFYITQNDYNKLWGEMTYESVEPFVRYVKSIPHGKEAQKNTADSRNFLKHIVQDKNALMKINPKVDSKNQRRVQCSFSIREMILSGVKYIKKDINITIRSSKRKFNK
jgi:hypothetical protein